MKLYMLTSYQDQEAVVPNYILSIEVWTDTICIFHMKLILFSFLLHLMTST